MGILSIMHLFIYLDNFFLRQHKFGEMSEFHIISWLFLVYIYLERKRECRIMLIECHANFGPINIHFENHYILLKYCNYYNITYITYSKRLSTTAKWRQHPGSNESTWVLLIKQQISHCGFAVRSADLYWKRCQSHAYRWWHCTGVLSACLNIACEHYTEVGSLDVEFSV